MLFAAQLQKLLDLASCEETTELADDLMRARYKARKNTHYSLLQDVESRLPDGAVVTCEGTTIIIHYSGNSLEVPIDQYR